jgi:hypothetical protein
MEKHKTKIRSIKKISSRDKNKELSVTRKFNKRRVSSLKSVTRKFKRDMNIAELVITKMKKQAKKIDDDAVFALTPTNPEREIETSFSLNNDIPWSDSFSLNNDIPWGDSISNSDRKHTSWENISSAEHINKLNNSGYLSDYSFVSEHQSPTVDYENNDNKLFEILTTKQNVKNKQEKLKNIKSIVFDKRIVKYLNTICSDSGECLAFGRESFEIRNIFDDFIDFRHLKKVHKIGQPSSNGFVLNLHYESMNYKANALLKSSKKKTSDNLFYEYLAGVLFINRVNEIFPCFTETYHLFRHNSSDTRENIKDNAVHINDYSTAIKLNDCDETIVKSVGKCVDDSCINGENYAILVQYINNPISINSFMKEHENDLLFEQQMLCILYQIYYPLSYLKDNFTHYDLHTDNVLLYKLPVGKFICIQYRNMVTGIVTNINTNYIAKIIDYGRCFFGNFGNNNLLSSNKILKTVKNSIVCNEEGLNKIGFNFRDKKHTSENHYISCLMKNYSHDLRLASIVVKQSRKMNKLFGCDRIIYTGNYGTPEDNSYDKYHIRNVDDMITHLDYLVKRKVPSINENDTPIGIIKVQLRGDIMDKMEFIQVG